MIILLLASGIDPLLLLRRFIRQDMQCVIVRCIDISIDFRHRYFYWVVASGGFDDAEVCADFVVAFRAP